MTLGGLVDSRYYLEQQLGEGSMGEVFRAMDRLSYRTVALKRVTAQAQRLSFSSRNTSADARVSLANEFQALATLRHPNIIPVRDYGFSDGTPYFTMRYVPRAKWITDYAQGQPLAEKLRVLMQMLRALAYLHRRGIIHRDLKPGNAIVGEDGQLMVLDFGLAEENPKPASGEHVAGTPAYIAPEVLQGKPPSRAADLYAVGVIAYELLAGQHPFDLDDPTHLLEEVVHKSPDLNALNASSTLTEIVARLLKKAPQERYAYAEQVQQAILATGLCEPAQDDAAVVNSFLQSARFVGREYELKLLTGSLEAARAGTGSAWLVGGESGVGKSRLLNELRVRALVQGALVLTGQGTTSGGLSYQLWRGVVRRMALACPMSDLDASILKEFAPDLPTLLGREIPPPPRVSQEESQQRIATSIQRVFRGCTRPMVLLLEDLHWMNESLDVLHELTKIVQELPLLILASYRSDEAPRLAERLPEMTHLPLRRLQQAEIARLSESMLGSSGREEPVLDLLQKETEGNVFFLVETVRALVEEAGSLDDVGRMTLPPTVFAGGVQKVVERRLNQVPAEYHELLQVAAVAGRQIDLELLRTMTTIDLDAWLTACVNSAVLALQDGKWQFAHDKLREGLLARMDDEELQRLSRAVAEALERLYPNDARLAHSLAHHWQQAGDGLKEAHYAYLTGGQLQSTQPQEARAFLHRALKLSVPENDQYADLLHLLGNVYLNLSNVSQAEHYHQQALEVAQLRDQHEVTTRALIGLGTAAQKRSDNPAAKHYYQRALITVQKTDNQGLLAEVVYSLGRVLLAESEFDAAEAQFQRSMALATEADAQHIIADSYNSLGIVHYRRGDNAQSMRYITTAKALREEAGLRKGVAGCLNNLGVIANAMGNYEAALEYYNQSALIKQELGDRHGLCTSRYNTGVVRMNLKRYPQAESDFREALELARELNFLEGIADAQNVLALLIRRRNGDLDEALQLFSESRDLARQLGDRLGYSLTLSNMADVLLLQGRVPDAEANLRESLQEAHQIDALQPLLRALMGYGRLLLLREEMEEAVCLWSFISLYEGCDGETRTDAEALLEEVTEHLSAERLVATIQKCKELTLAEVVQKCLSMDAVGK